MANTSPPNWCIAAGGTLEQGDILLSFPLVAPQLANGSMTIGTIPSHVIVLTQSCDIEKPSQRWLQVVQMFDYAEAASRMAHLNRTEYKNSLAEGTAIADFLIPPSPPDIMGWTLAHFRNVFTLPKEYVVEHSASRLRLQTPYREHFAQAYARFMMRVGLPNGLQPYARDIA